MALFDFETPEQVRARIGKTGSERDLSIAGITAQQGRTLAGAQAGRLFAEGIGEATGFRNPEITRANTLQTAMVDAQEGANGDQGIYLQNLTKNLHAAGMGPEAFRSLQALQQYQSSQVASSRASRRLAAEEKKAEAAMISAKGKLHTALGKGKGKFVSINEIKSVGAQLQNDPIFTEIDGDNNRTAYVASVAQSAKDYQIASVKAGRPLSMSQAIERVTAIARRPGIFEESWIDEDKVNIMGFNDAIQREIDNEYGGVPASTGSGFKVIK